MLATLQMIHAMQGVLGIGRVMQALCGGEKNVQDFLLVGFEILTHGFHLDLLTLQCYHCKNLTGNLQQVVLPPRTWVD